MLEIYLNLNYDLDYIADEMLHLANNWSGDGLICFVGFYDSAEHIIRLLVLKSDYKLNYVELYDKEYQDYTGEFLVSLQSLSQEITCEKMLLDNNRYLTFEADVIFIMLDCNSKVLSRGFYDDDNSFIICDRQETPDDKSYFHMMVDEKTGRNKGVCKTWADKSGVHQCSFYSTDTELVKGMAELFKNI